ncbi:MAG: glycosyltransferase family 2 protein, partial [Rhodothermales bacterium]
MTSQETSSQAAISIVIPAKNEAESLGRMLPQLRDLYPNAQILVVDDGSTDDTVSVCERCGVAVVSHPYSMGNGAAVKTGARAATGSILVFMDGDGQHDPDDIPRLLEVIDSGIDLAVGARNRDSQASFGRWIANTLYNRLASHLVGHRVDDLTSGFRAVRADKFREFIHLLPNGFSYPTTSTMAFFRAGYPVSYIPIVAAKRDGKSHISPIKDGVRFLLIIFKVATLYSPLKLFFPLSMIFFFTGIAYYLYTFFSTERFTNMGVLLFMT